LETESRARRLRPPRASKAASAPSTAPKPHVPALPPSYGDYDRRRLYEQVWSEPTQKVAARYGVSDVAIAKACRHLRIPKPPRGYWAKKAAGVAVPAQPPLPPVTTD